MGFGTLEAILGCVSAGFGISLLPLSVIQKHIEEGTIRNHPVPSAFGKVETVFIY